LGVNTGDRVRLQRAGDVIPYVVEVVEDGGEGTFEFPDRCPICDSAIERDGPLAFCTGGVACPAQLQRALEHYASREGLDIEGLGEERIDQLLDAELVESIPELSTSGRRISPGSMGGARRARRTSGRSSTRRKNPRSRSSSPHSASPKWDR